MAALLACFLLFSVEPWLVPAAAIFLIGIVWYEIRKYVQEERDWESCQPKRARGYHPNNGWEYTESSSAPSFSDDASTADTVNSSAADVESSSNSAD